MSLADIYMQIAGQNQADRERMREQLQSMAGNVATILQHAGKNKPSNAAPAAAGAHEAGHLTSPAAAETAAAAIGTHSNPPAPTPPASQPSPAAPKDKPGLLWAMNTHDLGGKMRQGSIQRQLEQVRAQQQEERLQELLRYAKADQGIVDEAAPDYGNALPPRGVVSVRSGQNWFGWNPGAEGGYAG